MSLFVTQLRGFSTTGRHSHPPESWILNLMPYRTYESHGYEAPFDSPIPAERTYSYGSVPGYEIHHEQQCPTPLPSCHYDQDSPISTAGAIEPFQLNAFRQDGLPVTGEDSCRLCRLLGAEQDCLGSHPITASTHYLDDGSHTLGQPPFPSTPTFGTIQSDLCQTPYSDSITSLSGSPSPFAAWPIIQENMVDTSPRGEDARIGREEYEEENVGSDKPYASLIWEALMQAPGHRMTLHEIYAWFQCNTNKARDSYSNGWQNSIRHNLSMNQAFENDKSDALTSRGRAKKASSVWMLTEKAIKEGIHSTTRYRKTGTGKKTHTSRTLAPLRQRSGARRGRAARRATRLRRDEQDHLPAGLRFPGLPSSPDLYGNVGTNGNTNDADYLSIHSPTTPKNDLACNSSAAFATPPYPTEGLLFYNSEEDCMDNGTSVKHEFVMQPEEDPCPIKVEHFPHGSNSREASM